MEIHLDDSPCIASADRSLVPPQVRTLDPYRLDQIDVYSNLLYVRGAEVDLTYLAYFATSVNKYCKETCAVVANFFALR